VFALGLIAALLASALFNVGAAVQALEARRAPSRLALRPQLLLALLRKWRWVVGSLLGLLGIGPQVLALATAPFVVVQPALSSGLLLLLLMSGLILREPVATSAWLGVAAIIGGLALVSYGAPSHSETHRGGAAVIAVVTALVVGALAPWPARLWRFDSAMLLIVASGVGFAASNVTTKLMSDDVQLRHWPNAVAWAIVGLMTGIAATLTGMTAFQRRPASIVVPVSTTVQTFLPIVLEPLFLREQWSSSALVGVPIVAGVAAALLGTVLVARNKGVSRLVAAGSAST
jgi:drug/metabolite transporter (DMT)-like permease